jgi:hypothetical protein
MKSLKELVEGTATVNKNAHIATGDHFKSRGYKEIAPN